MSVLSSSHTGASTASLLVFAALFVPAEMVMGFPAGEVSSPHNTTVRIFLVPHWPGWVWVRVRAGSLVVLWGLGSSAAHLKW